MCCVYISIAYLLFRPKNLRIKDLLYETDTEVGKYFREYAEMILDLKNAALKNLHYLQYINTIIRICSVVSACGT